MKKKTLIIAISILVIALVAVLFIMNKPYNPTSFVVDGEIFSATVEDGGTLILDLDNKKHRTLTMFCNQMIETNGGKAYGYSENYQLSNKDAGVNKEP